MKKLMKQAGVKGMKWGYILTKAMRGYKGVGWKRGTDKVLSDTFWWYNDATVALPISCSAKNAPQNNNDS